MEESLGDKQSVLKTFKTQIEIFSENHLKPLLVLSTEEVVLRCKKLQELSQDTKEIVCIQEVQA